MGLPWVRLDTQFPSNPKVLEMVADKQWRPLFVYLSALAYSGQHGTAGYIPDTALPFIHATKKEAEVLVMAGFWDMVPGGWVVHDWDECQFFDEASKKRRERAQKAASVRWANERRGRLKGV